MITYDDFLQTCYDLADDNTAATLTFISRMGNVGYKKALRLFGRQFEERTKTSTTVAGQQYYQLPIDYAFMKSVKTLVGTYSYPLEEIKGQRAWDDINRMPNIQNTRATKYFIRLNSGVGGDEVGIWPTPSASSNTITLVYDAIPRNVGNTSYITGTVSLTNGSTALTGVGTNFTPQLVGRYLKVDDSNGDGQWYKISAYTSATVLVLQNYYEGAAVNNSTYGIYELFSLPEEAQMIPVYFTMWHYYLMRQNDEMAKVYNQLYNVDFAQTKDNEATKSRDGVVKRGSSTNLYVDYPPYFPSTITSSS